MTSLEILGEIRKQQTIVKATDKDLTRAAGISEKTFKRKTADPDRFTLGEVVAIYNYLGMNERRKQ